LEYAVYLHRDSGGIPPAERTRVQLLVPAGRHADDRGNLPPRDTLAERVVNRDAAGGRKQMGPGGDAGSEKASSIDASHDRCYRTFDE
jgi:hypothetical protein